ncbi:hypothetical protein HFV01_02350 [Limnospira fusiformis SAG 85.79]|jgi:hypothetical protein|uniref:Uncharacterized protein n=3 Tax=Limnospira TaxID=2596745 RepID=A0A9P1KJZ6_9CYAN|nr:hypothetical protein AP285_18945 [Arthrospira platensis YZ]EDZ94629.1 hypothetical protein AmaxDRAFT_2665 [Limnospira maxima CS-328]EKD08599.1 hypothetical protein SPLC1_S210010 [Arthrospira platensis C1]KDR55798.1 hypothetical protein APPUASWS_020650 [Arthrospira platensis str. Paraca]QJB24856.1 hypothetical protein HFV01_02350 [Limnospira fusiformis SAG 85.79]CDM97774.1 conserved protein of unknown function [Limnospira indica PCC 8005]BAI92117.1 hypothetical protein NIES39_K04720 [Arthro
MKRGRRGVYDRVGNPNFFTDKNPSKLKQEGSQPANILFGIRVAQDLKDKLAVIPKRELRRVLTEFADSYLANQNNCK